MRDAERCSIMEAWDEMKGTLDGRASFVRGRLEPFAQVVALDGSMASAEYSWDTLRRMVRKSRETGRSPNAKSI